MDSTENVMITIEEIYDAAFNRRRFEGLLERLAQLFGAQASFIGWTDTQQRSGFQAQHGNDPVWLQSYVDTYAAHDVLRPYLLAFAEGECRLAWPLLQDPQITNSIFYREYLAPQGIVDNPAVNLIKRPGIIAHFALLRRLPQHPFTDDDCARLADLVPHLRRAIFIQSHITRTADRVAVQSAFYAGGNASVLLLTKDLDIVEADLSFLPVLNLQIGRRIGHDLFRRAVKRTIDDNKPTALSLTGDDTSEPVQLLIEARSLEPDRFGDLAAGPGATTAVHVTRIDQDRAIAFEAMGGLFGLTTTEQRVLRDAVRSGDLTAISKRLNIASATARTHLHRIYQKTGTRGFAGLASLAHRFGRISQE